MSPINQEMHIPAMLVSRRERQGDAHTCHASIEEGEAGRCTFKALAAHPGLRNETLKTGTGLRYSSVLEHLPSLV